MYTYAFQQNTFWLKVGQLATRPLGHLVIKQVDTPPKQQKIQERNEMKEKKIRFPNETKKKEKRFL